MKAPSKEIYSKPTQGTYFLYVFEILMHFARK